jgi:hypothetical protein
VSREAKQIMREMVAESMARGRNGETVMRIFGGRQVTVHRCKHAGTRAAWRIVGYGKVTAERIEGMIDESETP